MISQPSQEGPNITGLSTSLPALLSAYAKVLDQVSSEPLLQIHRRLAPLSQSRASSDSRAWVRVLRYPLFPFPLFPLLILLRPIRFWWWGFAIRPMVKLFIETHISSKTAHLGGRFLRQSRLKLAEQSGEDISTFDHLLWLLEYAKAMTVGWSRFLVLLRFAPIVGLLFTLGIVSFHFDPYEMVGYIVLVLLILPVIMIFVYALLVRFGFRWKRAFFLAWPSDPREAVDRQQAPHGSQQLNIYELENQVYSAMGIKKSREAPVDILLHPAPYWMVNTLALTIMNVVTSVLTPGITAAQWAENILPLLAVLLFFLLWTRRLIKRYRQRKAAGMV